MGSRAQLDSRFRIVVPKAVRERLGLKPGDWVVFREGAAGIVVGRLSAAPFGAFTEWSSAADDKAYSDL
jgi:AbrB family looped-hinge helix DNA binding protein